MFIQLVRAEEEAAKGKMPGGSFTDGQIRKRWSFEGITI